MSSIKTVDSALDFLPGEAKKPSLFGRIVTFFAAASEGLDALHKYKRLTSHGVQPADAAKAVLADGPAKN